MNLPAIVPSPLDSTRALFGALLAGASSPPPGPALVLVDGPGAGTRLPLGDGAVLGRGRSADLRVADALASRAHARVTRGEGGWRVRDLGSKNGLRVNGRRAAADGVPLAPGDLVALGASMLRYEDPAATPGARPAAAAERRWRAAAALLAAAAALAALAC